MKAIPILICVICVICGQSSFAQAPSSANSDKFKQFLERFPASDLDKDGVLTKPEVDKFNTERRKNQPQRERPARPEPTHADVQYGEHPQQAFDIWLAKSKDGKPTPLAIYIHGGGFRGGDKKGGANPQLYLDAGISYASMNYRLTNGGEFPYPVAMHDSALGLQTIRSKAKEWNLNPKRVACFGGSAGAGISLWLAFHDDLADPDSDDPIKRQSTRIIAAATSGGQSTYDMRTFRKWFGVPNLKPHEALVDFYAVVDPSDWETDRVKELMADSSSITHLDKTDNVPVYMTYSGTNTPVDENTSQGAWVHHTLLGLKLKEAMEALGQECTVTNRNLKSDQYASQHDFIIKQLK